MTFGYGIPIKELASLFDESDPRNLPYEGVKYDRSDKMPYSYWLHPKHFCTAPTKTTKRHGTK